MQAGLQVGVFTSYSTASPETQPPLTNHIHRCDLLDGLMASLAFKPVQARRLSDALKKKHSESLKGPAAAAQVEAPPVRIMLRP